ncbi:hypothetical protein ADINL_0699 [Nitrincola lacisaponensis]|uniref:Uncharacterized protein n=1 Tax=Nitrincola lacisaponensis TaxID=267850 RepID=A0A063Y6Q2_9GAMM|nr:hypothetical protein ADINL_0699 [Nitrincola lacisaponensis]
MFRLRRMLKTLSPDLIVSHNSRAAFALSQAIKGLWRC